VRLLIKGFGHFLSLKQCLKTMSKNLPYIMPSPQCDVEEGFANYQTTRQFYQEVKTRSEFQSYCEWYYTTAEQHRQDLEKMRGEINIFQWFRRW
jgi:hypothetical protein